MEKTISILFFLLFVAVQAQNKQNELKIVNFEELNSLVLQNGNTLYVVNFWATWCKPCIEELPGFMEVNRKNQNNENFKMILVSLDHPRLLKTKVKGFVERQKIDTDVYILDTKDSPEDWMSRIDPEWIGAIPSTIFYKNGKKILFKQFQISQFELEDLIDEFLD